MAGKGNPIRKNVSVTTDTILNHTVTAVTRLNTLRTQVTNVSSSYDCYHSQTCDNRRRIQRFTLNQKSVCDPI